MCLDADDRRVNKEHCELEAGKPNWTQTRIDIYNSHQPTANSQSVHQRYRPTHSEIKLLLPHLKG